MIHQTEDLFSAQSQLTVRLCSTVAK